VITEIDSRAATLSPCQASLAMDKQEQGKLKILTERTLVREYKILKLDAELGSVAGLLKLFTHNSNTHRRRLRAWKCGWFA